MKIPSDDDLQQLTAQVADDLLNREWLLSVAESCTGGWVAKCCTDLAGSSAWFDRGFVTYSNQAKNDMLGVTFSTLKQYGAASKQTVIEMAQGALTHSNANVSLAISGIAGPTGGTEDKPVGTVWLAWASKTTTKTQMYLFTGDRDAVRRQAVLTALQGIIS